MAITLLRTTDNTTFHLPDGLAWVDELSWSPAIINSTYTLSGALVVESSQRASGRPVTLEGGQDWAWMRRDDLLALRAAVTDTTDKFTLTLHDGRAFLVVPLNDSSASVSATPLPRVKTSGVADPDGDSWYTLQTLRFIIVA
jgi:hypothetical protein